MSTGPSDKIGVSTATIVGMNAMIGAGIFALPTMLATNVGPAGILSLAFVAGAVWFMAQSFARVAQLYPQEGSFYTYARQWGGHYAGIAASGSYIIGLLIAMGLLAHSAGDHLAHSFPMYSATSWGMITLGSLTLLNMLGVSLSELGQQVLIVCTVFPLIGTTVMCLTKANIANLTPFAPKGFMSILDATRFAAFGFFGFESSASLFSIIKEPEKNLPKALTYSLIAVATLYLAFVVALILAVPLHLFAQYPGPVANSLAQVFPNQPWVLTCIHISSLSAILGTLHSMIWASGTLLLSFIKKLRTQSTQKLVAHGILNSTTSVLLIGLGIYTSFATLKNTMFFNFTALFLLIAYTLSMATLLTLKEEWESGQNYITLAGFACAGLIAYFAITDMTSVGFFSKLLG
jgi:APA family basic amino acid/polyamine antiporter